MQVVVFATIAAPVALAGIVSAAGPPLPAGVPPPSSDHVLSRARIDLKRQWCLHRLSNRATGAELSGGEHEHKRRLVLKPDWPPLRSPNALPNGSGGAQR